MFSVHIVWNVAFRLPLGHLVLKCKLHVLEKNYILKYSFVYVTRYNEKRLIKNVAFHCTTCTQWVSLCKMDEHILKKFI